MSGAITEQEKVRLEIDKDTKIGVAKAVAEGIKGVNFPKYMQIGEGGVGGKGGGNPIDFLMQMFMVNAVEKQEGAKATK